MPRFASAAPSGPSAASLAALGPVPLRRYVLFFGLALGGLALDLGTKHWIFQRLGMPGEDILWLVPDVLSLETHLNEGALFGMGQGRQPIFVALSLVAGVSVVGWLFWWRAAHDALLTAALGSVSAGIVGNMVDRLGLPRLQWNFPPDRIGQPVYAVRDWIHFQIQGVLDWPVFNVADSLLVCGAGLLILHALFVQPSETAEGETAVRKDAKPVGQGEPT